MASAPVALITGGATGVGAATARWFAARHHRVLINYSRSAKEACAVAAECERLGVEALTAQGNVAEDEDCRRLAGLAAERWGRIDALVNCAGITRFIPVADLEGISARDFQEVFAVNTIGPFQMARAVAKHMPEGGSIVNVSSISVQTGVGSSLAYVTSKAALNALTVSLAKVLAPRIRVNAVAPGFIETRWMRDGLGDETYERVKKQYAAGAALGVVTTPEQIADAIGWLSTGSPVTTGQLIVVDAGSLIGPALAAQKKDQS